VVLEIVGSRPCLLVGCYFNPFGKIPASSLVDGLSLLERSDYEVIICGDFNSPCQAMRGLPPYALRGTLLDDYLTKSSKLQLISDFEFTFFRGEHVRSCLDGCIASQSLASQCVTTLLHALGPGHTPFLISVDIAYALSNEAPTTAQHHHRLDDKFTDWNLFFRTLKSLLPATLEFKDGHSVVQFTDAITQAQNASLLPKPTRLVNEGWWNEKCRIALRKRNSALRKLQKCRHNGTRKKFLRDKYVAARDSAKEIFSNERKRWKEWLIHSARNLPHRRVWNLITSLCGSKYKRRGVSSEKFYGFKAKVKAEEVCKSFESIQCATDLTAVQESLTASQTRDKGLPPEPGIEEWEVDEALSKVSVSSSPGPDGIRVTTLQKLWSSDWRPTILSLVQSMFRRPDLFQPFKHALIHPIPKPGNPDAFRPIALLSQLGKILERIIATRIRTKLDIPNQFGCYPHRSTRDALTRLQNWAVHSRYAAITIFFDVSKAYDRVVPELVLTKLRAIPGISRRMLNWVQGFLAGRSFQVRLGGFVSQYVAHPKFGLPQGSPLSVVLWQVFLVDLPIEEQDNLFMDDITFNIDEDSYAEAEDIANLRLEELDRWAKKNGVIFDRTKTKVMPHEAEVEVHLRFCPSDGYLPNVFVYKYLGVWLARRNGDDRGFSLHRQYAQDKTDFHYRLNWIKRLHGCALHVRRTAYISLVRSKLCYPLLLTIRNYEEDLEGLQATALRVVCGAMRSTPGPRLLQFLQLPTIFSLAKAQAARVWGKMLAFGGLLLRDYETWLCTHEGAYSPDTPFGLIQSVSLAPVEGMTFMRYSPILRDWCRTLYKVQCIASPPSAAEQLRLFLGKDSPDTHSHGDRSIEGFCDGGFSLDRHKGATGFVCYEANRTVSLVQTGNASYSPVFSSFHSELLAFRDILKCILEFFSPDAFTFITIYSDSRSLITGLRYWTRPSSQLISPLRAEVLSLLTSISAKQITLQWIPGHSGIPGNEQADSLASRALLSCPPTPIDVDLSYAHLLARRMLQLDSAVSHSPSSNDIFTLAPMQILNASICRRLLFIPAEHQRLISRLLLNHYNLNGCFFRHHLKQKGPINPDAYLCRFCSADVETAGHVVDHCTAPIVVIQRASLLTYVLHRKGASLLLFCLGHPPSWRPLFQFFTTLQLSL
jgi:ribonuclease HI